jgi:ApbE superfamily uncharacterized protein (UPF0280 family)
LPLFFWFFYITAVLGKSDSWVMVRDYDINIERLPEYQPDTDKSVYRSKVRSRNRYNWRILYKYSDILVSSDKNVGDRLKKLVKEIYSILESHIKENPSFQKSLSPLESKPRYHPVIQKMCIKSAVFNVGPMATVAGAVCDFLAGGLDKCGRCLIIENGGDVFIKSDRDVNLGVYLKDKHFADKLYLRVRKDYMPCGLCSSSGSFGHSLSMGKSDLVTVLAESTISADGAATSVANSINSSEDISKTINSYKTIKDIRGILIVKDDKLGIWGNIELIKS